ncbi:MAG: hypothetical protein JNL43_13070 [Flavobacteriales bacterium]|nr:hypothetical protein [Flavobacteriales bacterium]
MKASFLITANLNVAHSLRRRVVAVDRSLGVPPSQMRPGSRFSLQVRARITGLAGFPLQSLTRNTSRTIPFLRVLHLILVVMTGEIVKGQDSSAVAQLVHRIDQIHTSSEFDYFFDLDSVPVKVMQKLMVNTGFEGEVNIRSIHQFMADRDESYQATDVRTSDQPRRKFLFGRSNGKEMFFMYFHGGLGNHLHLVYVDSRDTLLVSTFATLRNWQTLNALEFEGRLDEAVRVALKTPLVNPLDMKALHGKVYDEHDLF